jgi:O-antigen/teichoic acid export membrane protein
MRTRRASIAALFGYTQFALAMAAGLVMVPFVVHRVGVRLYGFWLASGEILAYAAMADLGVVGILPWLIAQADGKGDRPELRRLMSNGAAAAGVVAVLYSVLVATLWRVLPAVLRLGADERTAVAGPLAVIACISAVVIPMRVFSATVSGLQDVKFAGLMSAVAWAVDLLLTVVLLLQGYRLYALALAAAFPSCLSSMAAIMRLRMIAPDLLTGWPRPTVSGVVRLFRESIGTWFSQWGWRLTSASDGIIVAALGMPASVTILACTSKLGSMLMQMSWVPGDSGLIGLANLHGENRPDRLRAAVIALTRVYVALAGAAVCIVLAANPAFVGRWVGANLFAGARVNAALVMSVVALTIGHMFSVVTSVLGARMRAGLATIAAGIAQVVLAFVLGRRFGLVGVVSASIAAQLLVLVPIVASEFLRSTAVSIADLLRSVALPLGARTLPIAFISAMTGLAMPVAPLWTTVGAAGAIGGLYLLATRSIYLNYPPILQLIDSITEPFLPGTWRRRLIPREPTP